MYDFYYNFILNKLVMNCYLLTQTLSLMTLTEDVYEELFKYQKLFGYSEYQSEFF